MSKLLGEIIGGTAGAVALFLILIACLWFYFLNIKASRNKSSDAGSSNQSTFVGSNGDVQLTIVKGARNFTLEELEQATKNFNDSNFVGVGSFGLVYKGLLLDGTVVAIKKRQGSPKQEFVEEAKCLSALWHRNIVTLIGYCQENSLQLLVYEYVPNGSVSSHLYDKGQHSSTKLEFKQRLSIAIGAAKGLSYIHSQIPIQVHNGFKTRNVLVDESFIAKVADAGMVKLLQRIEGSIGFSQDQIYHDTLVGETNDVYSFGIFLLELITGREVDRNQSSSYWVETNRDSTEFIDQRLATNFTSEGMKEVIDLTIRCLSSNYKERPKLEMVVKELDRIIDIEMTLTTVMGDSTAIVTLGSQLFSS